MKRLLVLITVLVLVGTSRRANRDCSGAGALYPAGGALAPAPWLRVPRLRSTL